MRYDAPVSQMILVTMMLPALLLAQKPAPLVVAKGVATPGVQIPISLLKPEAVFEVPGSPDWMAIGEAFWISNYPKGNVTRIDPKTNKIVAVIETGKGACSGLAIGFGSLWVPNCGDKNIVRVDLVSGKITATLPIPVADSEGAIATGAGSVWVLTDKLGTLARIDPTPTRSWLRSTWRRVRIAPCSARRRCG